MSILTRAHPAPPLLVCATCGDPATRREVTMQKVRADCPAEVWTEQSAYYCDDHRGTP